MSGKKRKAPLGSGARFESVEITSLKPDPHNARRHGDRNLKAVTESLRRFGQQKPIVVNPDGVVIAGNATLDAAKSLGWKRIDIVRSELLGSEAVAYAIADNRTAELAEWDDEVLSSQLQSLAAEGFDLDAVAFSSEELDALKGEASDLEEQDTGDRLIRAVNDPVQEDERPERGSVWSIGDSTLVVANPVTEIQIWSPLLEGHDFFVPYPSCLASLSERFKGKRCLFVQPIRDAAAYLLRTSRVAGITVERKGAVA